MNIIVLIGLMVFSAFILYSFMNTPEKESTELTGDAEDYYTDALKSFNEKQYRFAEKSFKLAMIQAKKQNKDAKLVAKIIQGMATTFAEQGRFADAEAMFSESKRMYETEFGIRDLRVATLNALWAKMLTHQMRYGEAQALLSDCLEIEEETWGPDHKDVLKTVNLMGDLLFEQEKWEEAEPFYRRSLARHLVASFNPKNVILIGNLRNLSTIYRKTGREMEAQELDLKLKQLNQDLQLA